jgi:hypothetical protein
MRLIDKILFAYSLLLMLIVNLASFANLNKGVGNLIIGILLLPLSLSLGLQLIMFLNRYRYAHTGQEEDSPAPATELEKIYQEHGPIEPPFNLALPLKRSKSPLFLISLGLMACALAIAITTAALQYLPNSTNALTSNQSLTNDLITP